MMIAQILQEGLIPTFVIDKNHIVTHWNRACEQLTGFPAAQMLGTREHWRPFCKNEAPLLADLVVDGASHKSIADRFGHCALSLKSFEGAFEAEVFYPDIGKDGHWFLATAFPLKNDRGLISGAAQTLQDITAGKQREQALAREVEELRRQLQACRVEARETGDALAEEKRARTCVEEALKQSEKNFRTVADFTYDWEYWINAEGFFQYISPACERITEYTIEEFKQNKDLLVEITHPDDRAKLLRHLDKELEAEGVFHIDFRIITRTGKELWISHFCQPVIDGDGHNLGRRASNRDITKRKRMEAILQKAREDLEVRVRERTEELLSAYESLQSEMKARKAGYKVLKESEEELRKRKEFIETVLEKLPIGLAVGTISDGVTQYMNSKFAQIYGWPEDALCSFDAFFEHVFPYPKYRKVVKNKVIKDIARRNTAKMVWENVLPTTSSGEQRVVTVVNIPLFEQDLMISTAQDVTEKHNASEALQFTRFSIDHANDMIYWVDPDGNIVDVNDTTCQKLHYTRGEMLALTVMDIDPGLTLDKFQKDWENIKQHGGWRVETTLYCKHGEGIPVEIHISQITFSGREYNCVFARDITERRELERLVAIQDKMGSLGRVAAGIAHEIRNPLSTINVYLSTLKRLLARADEDYANLAAILDSIEEMDTASHKIEAVVKRVMDFSKPSQNKMQLLDVNHCIKNAVDLSAVTLRKSGVLLEMQLDPNLPRCCMDSLLIEQLMMNLITNAIEELQDKDGEKQLLIETSEKVQGENEKSILIQVADSGSGVTPELCDRIFDPFFTTKHYGSGIGLSICQRIVTDHRGTLQVAASKWGGALFTAEFPVKNEVLS